MSDLKRVLYIINLFVLLFRMYINCFCIFLSKNIYFFTLLVIKSVNHEEHSFIVISNLIYYRNYLTYNNCIYVF